MVSFDKLNRMTLLDLDFNRNSVHSIGLVVAIKINLSEITKLSFDISIHSKLNNNELLEVRNFYQKQFIDEVEIVKQRIKNLVENAK